MVGRDELVDRSWDGRAVGNQAINRVIAILRRIAAEQGGPFTIETIPRSGIG